MKRTKLVSYLLFGAAALLTGDCVGIAATTKQKIGIGFGVGMGALGAYNAYKIWKNHKNRKLSALSRSQRLIELMKTVGLLSSGALVTYLALREREATHQPGVPGIQPVSAHTTNITRNVPTEESLQVLGGNVATVSGVKTPEVPTASGSVQSKVKEQTLEQLTPGFDLNTGRREKKEEVVHGFLESVEMRFASPESYGNFLALAKGRMHCLESRDYFAEPTLRQLQAVAEDKVNNRVPKAAWLDTLGRMVAKEFCERYDKSSHTQLKKLSDQFKAAFALES